MKDLIKLKREQALRENDDVHSADSQVIQFSLNGIVDVISSNPS